MKNYSIGLFLCLGLFALNAQSYKAEFRTDMCDCLTDESLKRQLTENAFKACLRETFPKYAEKIDASIVETDPNKKFLLGQIARKDVMVSMSAELIYTCDVYYKHIDFKRNSTKLIARENAKESTLSKYNEMVALTPNAMAYFMRADIHFRLGNIKKAEDDINKSLSLNPNKDNVLSTRKELMLLAWIYEEQERYEEAVAIYDKIYFGDLDTEVAKLRALANKKDGGKLSKIPTIKTSEIKKEDQTIKTKSKTRRTKTSDKNTTKPSKSNRTRTRKVEKKKDTASLRKLFKMGNG